MSLDLTINIKCDRCGREQQLLLRENCHNDSFSIQTYAAIFEANKADRYGWKMLDGNGRDVSDSRFGGFKVLCEPCAEAYKEFVRQRESKESEFFNR